MSLSRFSIVVFVAGAVVTGLLMQKLRRANRKLKLAQKEVSCSCVVLQSVHAHACQCRLPAITHGMFSRLIRGWQVVLLKDQLHSAIKASRSIEVSPSSA